MNIGFFYGVKRYIYALCIPGLKNTAFPPKPWERSQLFFRNALSSSRWCSSPCSGPLGLHSPFTALWWLLECGLSPCPHNATSLVLVSPAATTERLLVSICPSHLGVLPARLDPGAEPEAAAHLVSFLFPKKSKA